MDRKSMLFRFRVIHSESRPDSWVIWDDIRNKVVFTGKYFSTEEDAWYFLDNLLVDNEGG